MLFAECNNLSEEEFEPLALRSLSSGQSGILSDATNLVHAPKDNSYAVATTITNSPSGKLGQEWGWFGTGKLRSYKNRKSLKALCQRCYYENHQKKWVETPCFEHRLYIFDLLPPWDCLTGVYFCIALSTGQLPLQIFQSCTHSILLNWGSHFWGNVSFDNVSRAC